MIKIYVVVLILILLPNITDPNKPLMSTGVATCFVIVMMGFSTMLGYKKTKKMYQNLQITLDDQGIELKVPMGAYKRIEWSEASYVEKKNGDIKIYNNTVSATSRWWSGNGVILVQREINDREQLLLALDSHLHQS